MTQKELVIEQLKINGFISRNYCLSHFISRLSAITCDLNKHGWNLIGRHEGNDFVYRNVIEECQALKELREIRERHERERYAEEQRKQFNYTSKLF